MDYDIKEQFAQLRDAMLITMNNIEAIKKQIAEINNSTRTSRNVTTSTQEDVKKLKLAMETKYNHYHDEIGRFTDAEDAAFISGDADNYNGYYHGETGISAGDQYISGSNKIPAGYSETDMRVKPCREMSISKAGVEAITDNEGFVNQVYPDTAGNPTIGFGHKINKGEDFSNGITREEAIVLYQHDLAIASQDVQSCVKVRLTQPQFDALTSLSYNIGGSSLKDSTLIRRLNQGDYEGAAEQFSVWNKARDPKSGNKVTDPVLAKRRRKEEALFRSGIVQ